MKRVIILLLDSFGVGATADAASFGDQAADTFGHIAEECFHGRANSNYRSGSLSLPNLVKLGLAEAHKASTGHYALGFESSAINNHCYYGCAAELSSGKDTPSGHWEIAGVPVLFDWGYFPSKENCFPERLLSDLIKRAKLPGVLGNKHASGTEIINDLGDEHCRTDKPIVYTSADSVFQIAAHEKTFGLERLYQVCKIARNLVDEHNIGRVIARPFVGNNGQYTRTGNRQDIAVPPPSQTLFDHCINAGGTVTAIGKTADIFAHQGITETIKADGNDALFLATLEAMKKPADRQIIFTNFVDFDSKYGHRRDVAGYAHALETFDHQLPELLACCNDDDIVVIAADHGCDPTQPGSDHTRENIPVLFYGKSLRQKPIGLRHSFADIGQSIATYLALKKLPYGESFL